MFRVRTFKLKSLCDSSSWENFANLFDYIVENKQKIESTFSTAVFDQNFNEPMNVIILECDIRSPEVNTIMNYANKINELFKDNSDKIVVDFKIKDIPARYRKRVYFSHEWTIKEAI